MKQAVENVMNACVEVIQAIWDLAFRALSAVHRSDSRGVLTKNILLIQDLKASYSTCDSKTAKHSPESSKNNEPSLTLAPISPSTYSQTAIREIWLDFDFFHAARCLFILRPLF